MKLTYGELLDKLGVSPVLSGYETKPWQYYNAEKEIVCAAEVRVMDGDCDEVEAEIMLDKGLKEDGTSDMEIIMWLQARKGTNGKYTIHNCRFEGKNFVNELPSWETKICRFFKAVVREIKSEHIPDFDEIKEETMKDKSGTGQGGQGGGRAPKIKGNQLLNDMKRGGAGF